MVSFAELPQVAKITAFFPSHPLSQAIAALIAGVALKAQTGVPMTTRSDPEIDDCRFYRVAFLLHRTVASKGVGCKGEVILFQLHVHEITPANLLDLFSNPTGRKDKNTLFLDSGTIPGFVSSALIS